MIPIAAEFPPLKSLDIPFLRVKIKNVTIRKVTVTIQLPLHYQLKT